MSDRTDIAYVDSTWNPITGCTPISEACDHCYAKRMARRLAGRYGYPPGDGFGVTQHFDKLDTPLYWKKPRRCFVCSMSDLFHEKVQSPFIQRVLYVAEECSYSTFLFLTKRPGRMAEEIDHAFTEIPPNLWLGVTAENQQRADERIPVLLRIPAAVHWLSIEPCLGPVALSRWNPFNPFTALHALYDGKPWPKGIDWVVCGAETGPGARPMDSAWARSIRDRCALASVPFWYKRGSDGSDLLDGQEYRQLPEAKP